MTVDEVDFLEHFGVKGMKWGQRKDRSGGSSHEKMSTQKKVAIGAATTVAIGGAAAAVILKKNSGVKISSLPKRSPELEARMASVVQKARNHPTPSQSSLGIHYDISKSIAGRKVELSKMTLAQLREHARNTPTPSDLGIRPGL